jgi:hypothetical protein
MAKSRSASSKSKSGSRSGSSRSRSTTGKSSSRGGSASGGRRAGGSRSGGGGMRSRTARTSATASRSTTARSKSGGAKSGRGKSGGGGRRGGGGGETTQFTTDPEQIRRWAEARGGRPACVRGTEGNDESCLLRIDFPGYTGEESLQPISWDEFFRIFERRGLALLYQETTKDGQRSNFNKLVDRNEARGKARSGRGK